MINTLGLSHIVFTVNKTNIDSYLKDCFNKPKKYSFDHSSIRYDMIRHKRNSLSDLEFFVYKDNTGPSVELIKTVTQNKRPDSNFGLIDKTFSPDITKVHDTNHIFFGNISSYFSKCLNCQVIISSESIETDFGCWIKVSNFESHVSMLRDFFALKLIYSDNNIAKFKTSIINKSLSPFTLVLIKSRISQNYFNDDIGLSSLGWFVKDFPKKTYNPFSLSNEFKLSLFTKKLTGRFIFDNNGISHELLKI